MVRFFVGAALAAALGALVGAAGLALAYRASPAVTLPLDRAAPRVLTGFHGLERSGDLTFAWTGPTATVRLPGVDRGVAWRCAVRLRGARAPGVTQPTVSIDVDGVPAARVTASNVFEDIAVEVPAVVPPGRAVEGLGLTITSTPTFVPGTGDRRELGVQVDHIACAPAGQVGWPPRRALMMAGLATASIAVAAVALGAPVWLALLAACAVGVAQAWMLAHGLALYTPGLDRVPWLAGVPAAMAALSGAGIAWRSGRGASAEARFALAYSAIVLYLLLLALLHPSKAIVDAQFHAHRLEWVHAGRYFFTQPMPDGVAFPYAIALYVVASPWMAITRDHVALLRIVVCTAHVLAGLLLYVAVARRWKDPLAGALAVVLWSLVPQWFVVVGNANLTGAFAQSMATATLLTAAILELGRRDAWSVAVLFTLASVAFLSHVGTFPLLFVTMLLVAAVCWWRGTQDERVPAGWIAAATLAAAVFAVVTYYGHFAEVYKSLDRVTGRATAVATPVTPVAEPVMSPSREPVTPQVWTRGATAAGLTLRAVGWPIALLWLLGAWRVLAWRQRDRLTLALLAWFATCAAFVGFAVLAPVEARFYRYTVEFIGRVVYATWPAAIVVAAAGGAWAWRAGSMGRLASALLVAAAVWVGGLSWWNWIR